MCSILCAQEDGTGSSSDADCVAKSKLIFKGGDPGKATIGEWIGTVNKPENWYIIHREGVKPITDFLHEPEPDRIKQIQDRQQKKQWITPMIASLAEVDGGGVEIPAHPELPYFLPDARVTLLNLASNKYLIAKNGIEGADNQPDARAQDDSSRNLDANDDLVNQVAPGAATRIEGIDYAWCQPAPLLKENFAGPDPKEMNLLWTLVYTGRSDNHSPLYWLVSQDEKWVLSGFHVPNIYAFACLFPFEEAKKLRHVPSPTRWAVTYAAPPGLISLPALPDETSGHFRIYNPYIGGYLSEEMLLNSQRQHWVLTKRYIPSKAGAGYWVPDRDVLRTEAGPQFTRTAFWADKPDDFASVFGTDGKPVPAKEIAQQKTYKKHICLAAG
jgi:hypothetical protein